eukprot:g75306.t1
MSLHLATPESVVYKIHPVVVFSILDHFKRRKENQERVVGTLLGHKKGNDVFICNCFPVPAKLNADQTLVDIKYHNKMLELYNKVNRDEVVVGWYSTGDEITWISSQIHQQMYMQEIHDSIPTGVHLTVNVNSMLQNKKLELKAYTAKVVFVGDKEALARFERAPLEYHAYESEKIGVDSLINGEPVVEDQIDAPASILSDFENLDLSLTKLLEILDTVSAYVNKVREGKERADPAIGLALQDAIASVPQLQPEQFKSLLNQKIQSLLMVSYLTNLTRAQVALADRMSVVLS